MNNDPAAPASVQPSDPGLAVPQFYIPASESLEERRPRTLKHGDTFAVLDQNGDVLSGPDSPDGVFHLDTRRLSHFDFMVGGARPMLLSSTLRDDNAALSCDLTNPDLFDGERLILQRDLVHIRRSKFLWKGVSYERLMVRSFADRAQSLTMQFRFAADFADLFEVRGSVRAQRGTYDRPQVSGDTVRLGYTGLDGVRRITRLRFCPAPDELTATTARYDLNLAAGCRFAIYVVADCGEEDRPLPVRLAFAHGIRGVRGGLRRLSHGAASVSTSNEIFNEGIRRSIADLYMLVTEKPEGPYPYAGIPWFSTAFGRDAIITALEMLWLDPSVGRGVLRFLAANQATEVNAAADAEPGKILHELRAGEMAELGEVPFRRYYGSIDSTPLFVTLAGYHLARTGDVDTARELWPSVEAALHWIDRYGDRDGDGFVEYGRMTAEGLANQGWKDSYDSVFHADGRLAAAPIALCEVQGYVFSAKRAAATMAHRLGHERRAAVLHDEAKALQQRFEDTFWCEDLGTYALALDGEKKPCRVRSSNAGHLLYSGIVSPERALRVARQLMDLNSFSGWGIRTIPSGEARYNPMSYHNGSVWPHDNALIALGLSRYGHKQAVMRLFEGLFAASEYMDLRRLPELFCGFPRRRGVGPTAYPVACSPQAWAAAAPLALLKASLGLMFDPEDRVIRLENPQLPAFLDEVVLQQLRMGDATLDLLVRRYSADTVIATPLARTGNVKVIVVS